MSLQSLQLVNVFYKAVTGLNGAGSISVPGVEVGDVILVFYNGYSGGLWTGSASPFESTVSVVDEVQQTSSGNWSAAPSNLFFLRIQS